ncbi:hypothetical protein B0T20DRAFT_398372 [Sordaria brevicollis]|uniref:Uncharacterized protein n=1 Tax=Sordaria brevicollis TaxID=83679 RepID=A0AAE0UFL1_SORBR|nr:hypothetical protein B0T20DRAFT_398372 [Sordaria brevicollis]
MGFMNDRLGQFMPTGINGTNMQILHVDTANALATTLLPSHMQSLICFVLEGTLEVNMLGIPVFTINMHSQFAVRAGQTCHVRNLGGIRASLYVISVSVALQ